MLGLFLGHLVRFLFLLPLQPKSARGRAPFLLLISGTSDSAFSRTILINGLMPLLVKTSTALTSSITINSFDSLIAVLL
uniref:Uncharacterized protein n=1 Tax=uncultured marine virus TaxID=186617 RepID=A0A0F7L5D5_9VIRU|nr:hypothetical protein [uncultured marine virus]